MGQYEEIVRLMRTEGAKSNPEGIRLAVMTGPDSCKIGDFPLMKEDLLFADHLLVTTATKVSVTESHSDASLYLTALKSGDTVAVIRLNVTKYLVLERVVSA